MLPEPTLRGVATVNFYADDMQTARQWYCQLLGIEPYFTNPREGPPAYIEFRLGDYQHELGIIDRRYAPPQATSGTGGAIVYWHVDDLEAMLAKAMALGAQEYEPLTPRGNSGFVTAAVVDPFGNILGMMSNPHYVEVLEAVKKA